jgi:hypothetical protein
MLKLVLHFPKSALFLLQLEGLDGCGPRILHECLKRPPTTHEDLHEGGSCCQEIVIGTKKVKTRRHTRVQEIGNTGATRQLMTSLR